MIYSQVKVQHDRIKDALSEWAKCMRERMDGNWPNKAAFVVNRVDNSGSDDAYYFNIPDRVVKLDKEIEGMPPMWKIVINLEYMHGGPKKAKGANVGMSREVFTRQLAYIHTFLDHKMFGVITL